MPIAGPTTNHDEIRHWAETFKAVPAEILPEYLDHEPTTLRMMLPQLAADLKNVRVLTWEEFFTKFDLLGLSFVYDDESGGYNELLQIEDRDPHYSNRSREMQN